MGCPSRERRMHGVKAQRREAWGESRLSPPSCVVHPRPHGRSACAAAERARAMDGRAGVAFPPGWRRWHSSRTLAAAPNAQGCAGHGWPCSRISSKKLRPGVSPRAELTGRSRATDLRSTYQPVNSLAGDRADRLHRRRGIGGRLSRTGSTAGTGTAGRLRTATRLAAAVAGRAVGLAAAAGAAAALASVLGLQRRDHVAEHVPVGLPPAAARGRTTARLAAASTGVAGRLRTAVAGSAGGLSASVASTASRLAAAVASVARRLGAATAAAVLPLALREQTLQAAEQVVLLADPAARRPSTAARLAAASTGVAGRLRTAVTGSAGGLRTAIAGTTAGLAAASTGVAAGLTARGTALAAEHPVEELETEGLATNGDAEDQRTEIHHTLHRATSPLLVNHRRGRPARDEVTPRFVIHVLSAAGLSSHSVTRGISGCCRPLVARRAQ